MSKQGKPKVNLARKLPLWHIGITSVSRLFYGGADFVNFSSHKRGCGALWNLRV